MKTIRHTDAPGSTAWHQRRARCYNAGDASAMLGCHPSGKTRTELLREVHTGIEQQFSDYVQDRVIDPGHRIEALWRPIAEEVIGEELYVLGGELPVHGLSRPLGASLDGLTLLEDTAGECKSANEALRAALPNAGRDSHQHNDARQLPKGYRVQMEQQQMVVGAARTLFSACQFDNAGNVTEERHCWYYSDLVLRAEILAGWKQFDADLAAYVPVESKPEAVAAPVESLPAVLVQMTGSLAVNSNLDAFGTALRAFIDRIPAQPTTDQEFADTDAACKALKRAEDALEAEDKRALDGMADVATVRRIMADLKELARATRLQREKLVKARKDQLRLEQVQRGRTALAAHLQALNQRLGAGYMPDVPADFAGVISGKKTMSSIADAIDTELARAKIAASEIADRIQANMQALAAAQDKASFPDAAALVLKAPDDLAAIIGQRVAEAERRAEAQRERIRKEEADRLEREAKAAAEKAEREAREAQERQQREEAARTTNTTERAPQQVLKAEAATPDATDRGTPATASPGVGPMGVGQPADAGPTGGNVVPIARPAQPPADTGARIKLGDIVSSISPMAITADGLSQLGFKPVAHEGAAKLYRAADLPAIYAAMVTHIEAIQAKQAA